MRRSITQRLRREDSGFTLIELTTTMAVFGIFLAAVALVLGGAIRNSSAVEDQASSQAETRPAVDALAGELRQGYSDSTLPNYPYAIQTWNGTTLTFYTPDRQSPYHMLLVSYRLSGGQLQRAVATSTNTASGPWSGVAAADLSAYRTLARSVTNSTLFTYWQNDGTTAATTLANLAFVRITVTVSPRGSQGRTSSYIVNASLRT